MAIKKKQIGVSTFKLQPVDSILMPFFSDFFPSSYPVPIHHPLIQKIMSLSLQSINLQRRPISY